jgi:hypothetical protein
MKFSMLDVGGALGAELARSGAVERLRPLRAALARAELGEPAAHVDLIIARLERLLENTDEARILKLAALVHELGPERVERALSRLGVEPAAARAAEAVVASFWAAEIWQHDGVGLSSWARRAGTDARKHLLFEVAHEGAVTPGMRVTAELVGLEADLDRWRSRLPG